MNTIMPMPISSAQQIRNLTLLHHGELGIHRSSFYHPQTKSGGAGSEWSGAKDSIMEQMTDEGSRVEILGRETASHTGTGARGEKCSQLTHCTTFSIHFPNWYMPALCSSSSNTHMLP